MVNQTAGLILWPDITVANIGTGGEGRANLNGSIGEVIIYYRALSSFEREEIEEYLSKKWKITLSD